MGKVESTQYHMGPRVVVATTPPPPANVNLRDLDPEQSE